MRVSCEGRLCIPPARRVLPGFSAQTIALEPITPSSSLLCEEDSLVVILLLQSSPCKSLPPKQCPATTTCLGAVSTSLQSDPWGHLPLRSAQGPQFQPMVWMVELALREPWEGLSGETPGMRQD